MGIEHAWVYGLAKKGAGFAEIIFFFVQRAWEGQG